MSDPNLPNDPHEPGRRHPHSDRAANSYTAYIVAGAAVIVLILAVIVFTGPGDEAGDPMATDPAIEEPAVTGTAPPADPDAAPAGPDTAPADPDAQPALPEN